MTENEGEQAGPPHHPLGNHHLTAPPWVTCPEVLRPGPLSVRAPLPVSTFSDSCRCTRRAPQTDRLAWRTAGGRREEGNSRSLHGAPSCFSQPLVTRVIIFFVEGRHFLALTSGDPPEALPPEYFSQKICDRAWEHAFPAAPVL